MVLESSRGKEDLVPAFYKNTGLHMLKKHGKFCYAAYVCREVTIHKQHLNKKTYEYQYLNLVRKILI